METFVFEVSRFEKGIMRVRANDSHEAQRKAYERLQSEEFGDVADNIVVEFSSELLDTEED